MIYKKTAKVEDSLLEIKNTVEGEMLEQKVERIMKNNEPITDGAPIVYTERKDGVRPEFNIKTDRFDLAIDATDKASKGRVAKRQLGIAEREKEENPPKAGGTDEPSQ